MLKENKQLFKLCLITGGVFWLVSVLIYVFAGSPVPKDANPILQFYANYQSTFLFFFIFTLEGLEQKNYKKALTDTLIYSIPHVFLVVFYNSIIQQEGFYNLTSYKLVSNLTFIVNPFSIWMCVRYMNKRGANFAPLVVFVFLINYPYYFYEVFIEELIYNSNLRYFPVFEFLNPLIYWAIIKLADGIILKKGKIHQIFDYTKSMDVHSYRKTIYILMAVQLVILFHLYFLIFRSSIFSTSNFHITITITAAYLFTSYLIFSMGYRQVLDAQKGFAGLYFLLVPVVNFMIANRLSNLKSSENEKLATINQLEYCKNCVHKIMDKATGIACQATGVKPKGKHDCPGYVAAREIEIEEKIMVGASERIGVLIAGYFLALTGVVQFFLAITNFPQISLIVNHLASAIVLFVSSISLLKFKKWAFWATLFLVNAGMIASSFTAGYREMDYIFIYYLLFIFFSFSLCMPALRLFNTDRRLWVHS